MPSDVPDVELDVLVGYGFDIEADCRDGGYVRVDFELIKDCLTPKSATRVQSTILVRGCTGLSSSVET